MKTNNNASRKLVFFYWFRHWRSGRIVRRANGKPFAIWK